MDWALLDWPSLVREFVTLFVVIDPIGTIPVYLYAVRTVPPRKVTGPLSSRPDAVISSAVHPSSAAGVQPA